MCLALFFGYICRCLYVFARHADVDAEIVSVYGFADLQHAELP